MANTARVTQSFLIAGTLQVGTARVTQSFIIAGVGLGISCNNPPNGLVGASYSHAFPAGSGDPPYTFSISAGALPPGLVLNSITGVVSGTAITAGTYPFTITVTDSFTATASVRCAITIAGTVPPSGSGGGGTGQGHLGRSTLCGKHKNQFDWCMFAQSLVMRDIDFPPMCTIPAEYRQRYPLPWDEDFGANAIPPQARPLSKIGSVVTPATAAGDVLVIQDRVPYGYDGLLAGFFVSYTGQGFEQGSGDIVWRLQLNQRYLEDLGNLPFALGSSVSPCPLTEGQILLSGQLIRLLVNVPNLSGNIQIGNSRINGGLFGFYWPR